MTRQLRRALLAIGALLAVAAPATGQEIRPTLDKFKETGVARLGYRETSRPFSFVGSDGKPTGYSIDLCLQIVAGAQQALKLFRAQGPMGGGDAAPIASPSSSRARSIWSAARPPSPSGAWSRSPSAT